jgi:anthranilate synthase component I
MKDSGARSTPKSVVPIIETMSADLLTPLAVYLKLSAASGNSFLLESVEGGESVGRYSFVGVDPEMIVRGNGRAVEVEDSSGRRSIAIPTFDFLRDHFATQEVTVAADLPPFIGGAIGYFGFDCSGWFEPSLEREPRDREDQAALMFFRSVVAFDHAKQIISIISLIFPDEINPNEMEAAYQRAGAKNEFIRHVLMTGAITLPEERPNDSKVGVTSNWTRESFEAAVRHIKELIRAGECYQVVISQRFSRSTGAHPISIYRAMRSLNPSPYMFIIRVGDRHIIGASPEMLIKCSDRDLEYRPIAGTRRRGKTAVEDAELSAEMRADAKEVAEHLMLVDLGRNDLGRVAEYGSVKVDVLMDVEKYSHVQHLVSHLSGKLRPGLDRFDALGACFPAGTVSGAPKVRAIEIINSLEPDPRGVYAGAVGYFDYAGNMDTCIAIRTLVLENGIAHIQAGAGIVADSDPASEYEETVNKAEALLKAIDIAESRAL